MDEGEWAVQSSETDESGECTWITYCTVSTQEMAFALAKVILQLVIRSGKYNDTFTTYAGRDGWGAQMFQITDFLPAADNENEGDMR